MLRTNTARSLVSKLPLLVILLAGAFLRFHNLGAQSLEFDELLVPLAAQHSLSYIFNLCSLQETHPPLFYLLIKTVLSISASDAALRVLSAVAGIAAIYFLYRVVLELAGRSAALFSAALFSVNVLHLVYSRRVRPYSLFTTLFLIACLFLVRLVRQGRWRDLIWLLVVNFLLFWLHYLTFHLVIAQGIVLAIFTARKSSPFTVKQFAAFCIVTLLTALPIYIWFIQPSLAHQLASEHGPRAQVLYFIGRALRFASSFFYWEVPPSTPMWLFPLAGSLVFLFRKPRPAALCLLIGAIPLAIVLASASRYPLQIWHVVWLTPLLSLFASLLLSWLPASGVIAPLLAVGGALFILLFQPGPYYKPVDEYSNENWRGRAERLEPLFAPGALIADASVPGIFPILSWYWNQPPANPLATQRLEPGSTPVTLHFIAEGANPNDHSPQSYVPAVMGSAGNAVRMPDVTVNTFQVERRPVGVIETLPAAFVVSGEPKDFYSHVFALRDVRSVPTYTAPLEYPILDGFRTMAGGIIATQNNEPGLFDFVLTNNTGDKPMLLSATLRYINTGKDSTIGLFARFDDEPLQFIAQSSGPDNTQVLRTNLRRDKPFTRLTLQVRMYCTDKTSMINGESLRTLVFQGLRLDMAQSPEQRQVP